MTPNNRKPTQSLIYEFAKARKMEHYARFTIAKEDRVVGDSVYPSLYKIYMEMEDPAEFNFVMATIGDWAIWEQLCENKLFSKTIDQWRKELAQKLKSRAYKEALGMVEAGKATYQILQMFAKPEDKNKAKVGRPKKEPEVKVEAPEDIAEDFKRLGLRVVE
jgi:hypothetical protein